MTVEDLRWVLSRPNERGVFEVFAREATTAEALEALEAEPDLQVVSDRSNGRAHVVGRVSASYLRSLSRPVGDEAWEEEVERLAAKAERLRAALAWIAENYDSGAGFYAERVLNDPDHEQNLPGDQ